MIHKPEPETPIEEIHRIRREISTRFGGNIAAIAEDAARRQLASGRPVWQAKPASQSKSMGNECPAGGADRG